MGWLDKYKPDKAQLGKKVTMLDAQVNPEYIQAMDSMVKSKIGRGDALNHPSIKRITTPYPKTGMTPEGEGTHYMSSMDNYAVPLLQDVGEEELQYIENPIPSQEDIEFNSPEEAEYFSTNYKRFTNWHDVPKAQGGDVVIKNERLQGVQSRDNIFTPTFNRKQEQPLTPEQIKQRQEVAIKNERLQNAQKKDAIFAKTPNKKREEHLTPEEARQKQAMLAEQYVAERQGDITEYTPQSTMSRAKEIALNPATAFGYFVRNEELPENFSRGDRASIDYALDFANPASYIESANSLAQNQASVFSNLAQGNFQEAGIDQLMAGADALSLLPIAKPAGRFVKNTLGTLPPSLSTINKSKNIKEALGTFTGIPTERSLARLSPEELKIYRQAQEIGRMRSTGKPISEQYKYALEQGIPEEHLQQIFRKSKSEIEAAIPDALQDEAFRAANPIRDRLNLQRPPRRTSQSDQMIDVMNSSAPQQSRSDIIRHTLDDYGSDSDIEQLLERVYDNQLTPIPEELIINTGSTRGRTLIPGQRPGMTLGESFNAKNAEIQRNIYNNLQSYKNKIINSTQDYPVYSGPVLENVPSLSLSSSGSLKNVSNKVTGQSTSGINSGDVFTGSLNTSHSSYLPQLKQVFKYGEGSPQFLGYKPMNQMGFLSNFNYSADDIAKYLNTEIDEQIKRGIIPKNIARPYSRNESVILPHYGIKQFQEGGVIKDNMGYWNPDNWGSPVEINSNNITMEGVYEPLLGISDTGDTKLMEPGKNYKFKGKKVTEFPIAKNGGWLDSYQDGGQLAKVQDGSSVDFDYVNYGTPEYKEAYEQGRFAHMSNPLDEVTLTPYDQEYPYYQSLSPNEKKMFEDEGPVGRGIRRKARTQRGLAEDTLDVVNPLLYGVAGGFLAPYVLAPAIQGMGAAGMAASPFIEGAMAASLPGLSTVPGATVGNALIAGGVGLSANELIDPQSATRQSVSTAIDDPTFSNVATAVGNSALTATGFILPNYGAGMASIADDAARAGNYLTTQTPLKNTYKINPWAFKPNPDFYYRMGKGRKFLDDVLETNKIRAYNENSYANLREAGKISGIREDGKIVLKAKTFPEADTYWSKGVPLDGRYASQKYGDYMIEASNDIPFIHAVNQRTKQRGFWDAPDVNYNATHTTGNYVKPRQSYGYDIEGNIKPSIGTPLEYNPDLIKLYKPHWLKGYKEVPKQLPGSSNTFKSEIDWGKWNPDTPKYPELINEYNAIEESTKKAGTWMKNPDGSPFQGTPEQFIQQQSSWFKKAFPQGSREVYRGVGVSNANPDFSQGNSAFFGDRGIFTANKNLAKEYAHGIKSQDVPILTPFDPKGKPGIYSLSFPKGKQIDYNADLSHWTDVNLAKSASKINLEANLNSVKEILERFKKINNPLDAELIATYEKRVDQLQQYIDDYDDIISDPEAFNIMRKQLGDITTTDNIAAYIPKTDLNNITLRNIIDGGLGDVTIVNSKPGNYLKSNIGNVGFFDMTNPNIYKSLIPIGGVAAATQLGNNEEQPPQFRKGGKIKDLVNLTNFTNYNTSQPGSGWLSKYE